MRICTIAARNYLANVIVWARTCHEHNPDAELVVLIVDGHPSDPLLDAVPFEPVFLDDIDISASVIAQMDLIYDVTEFATAVKPTLLRTLLARSPDPVVYVDPDVQFFGSIGEAGDLADAHGIVLTPHVLTPVPDDGLSIVPTTLSQAGIYNLGFIGVGPSATDFLEWWEACTRFDALVELGAGLFTDQKWIDFVPSTYDHIVIKDPGWNIAYWNLHERPLTRDEDGTLRAGGSRVRFVHFSGYDPEVPYLLSRHQGVAPRLLLSELPVLRDLTDRYGAAVVEAGRPDFIDIPYGRGRVAGRQLPLMVRRMVRAEFRPLTDPGGAPFVVGDDDDLIRWLNEPVACGDGWAVTRLAHALWAQRGDLQAAFPQPRGADGRRFCEWCATDETFLEEFGYLHRPDTAPIGVGREASPGINVVGYLNAELGIGEAARRMAHAAEHAGLPVATVGYRHGTVSRQADPFARSHEDDFPHLISLLCVNADGTPELVARMPEAVAGRYRVGLWFWELSEFPPPMHVGFEHVDEVWVTDRFVADAVQPHTAKPVHVVPLPVLAPSATALSRRDLGLPDGTVIFLSCHDVLSVPERKNPVGTLRAYLAAFGPHDGTTLVLKSINGAYNRPAMEELRYLSLDRPDVLLVDRYLDRTEMQALYQLTDCYISLHRSEGFGLNLASAMAAGKPVIGTGYSGNMAFMNPDNSLLVPYDLVPVGPGNEPYQSSAQWAEPDLEVATTLLRWVAADPDRAGVLGDRARSSILQSHGLDVAARAVAEHFDRITASLISRR